MRLIVFDLDGTLVDSRRDLAGSANEMLTQYGAPPIAEDGIGRMVGGGAAMLVSRALAASALDVPLQEALARFLAIYDRRLLDHTRPYPGIPDLLSDLHEHRNGLALLTNKPLAPSLRILDAFDLTKFFSLCAGGDGPQPRKPAPEGLQVLMASAGVSANATLMVGDSFVDLKTARNARVPVCLVRYGFGFSDLPQSELTGDEWIADAPDGIAAAVNHLLPVLLIEDFFRHPACAPMITAMVS